MRAFLPWVVAALSCSSIACSAVSPAAGEGGGGSVASTAGSGGERGTPSSATAGVGGSTSGAGSTTGAGGAGGTPAPTFAPGLFVLGTTDKPISKSLAATSSVAGLAVRTAWSTNEPSDGVYDWTFLDAQIQEAKSAGKKISIYVAVDTPAWLTSAGVQSITFTSHNGNTHTIPVPWDQVFLGRFTDFIAAFGARYHDEPTVAYVRGATEAVTNGWGLTWTTDDGTTLADHGYASSATLLDAMKRVVDAMMTAFPATPEWLEVGIVDDPTPFGIPTNSYFGEQIAAYSFTTYPDRSGVWREDLSACTANPPTRGDWTVIAAHPGRNGAQMVWNVEDGPPTFRMDGCMKASPNDAPTVLNDAIQNGVGFGMHYFEIYASDWDNPDPGVATVLSAAAASLGAP
jgi:hypothetical protein